MSKPKTDFLGQPFTEGGWIAATGKGNSHAEYGMILYQITEILPDKLKARRLRVSYKDRKPSVTVGNVRVSNPNKYIVVHPPAQVTDLFQRAVDSVLTDADCTLIGKWIHGMEEGLFA
jgi:hypothetical protein